MTGQQRPTLKTPPGATDTHMHVYGSEDEYPPAPTAAFLPPPARVADYQKIQARLGLDRAVVVQASAYGTDNRCTMDAVARLGRDRARAVVVVDQTTTDAELERLTRAGARGIRFHMFRGGALPWGILEEMAARVHPFGWHVSFSTTGASSRSARPC
jgi:D-galactarolactone isomerase